MLLFYQLIVFDSLDDDTRRSQDYLNVHVYEEEATRTVLAVFALRGAKKSPSSINEHLKCRLLKIKL